MNAEHPDTRRLAADIRDARSAKAPLRIVGAGTWLDAGRPVRDAKRLHIGASSGIVEYEPGDLTLTVRAGTSLAEIDAATREHGQWLPLDPFGDATGTIGATVATASWGPLASSLGTPRDQVIGCEFVTGMGAVARAGGRVVKNVAGFDLVRLMTGAWGTLGVITEVALRLRARPEREQTLAIQVNADTAWRWLHASEFTPLAAELVSRTLSERLGLGSSDTLLLRLGGNDALMRGCVEAAKSLGEVGLVDQRLWSSLASSEPSDAAVVRVSVRPARVSALWDRASSLMERVGGMAHATLARGVVRCIVPIQDTDGDVARLRGIIGALRIDATCIVERLPAPLWASLVPSAAAGDLSQRVRRAFDPDHILNPGILGELA